MRQSKQKALSKNMNPHQKKVSNIIQMQNQNSDEMKKILQTIKTALTQYDKTATAPKRQKHLGHLNQYSLAEDLKIIQELSKPNFSLKELVQDKILNRSYEGIKKRYQDCLKHLKYEDMQKIEDYYQKNGITGYLIFSKKNKNGKRKLEDIEIVDPYKLKLDNLKLQKKIKKEDNGQVEEEKQPASTSKKSKKKQKIETKEKSKQKKQQKETKEDQIVENKVNFKRTLRGSKRLRNQVDDNEENQEDEGTLKKIPKKMICKVYDNLISQNNQNQLIKMLANDYTVDETLIKKQLEQMSGNLSDLKNFYLHKEQNLLWSEEEDQCLKNVKAATEIGFKLILQYKGQEKLEERLKYLNLKLDFEF